MDARFRGHDGAGGNDGHGWNDDYGGHNDLGGYEGHDSGVKVNLTKTYTEVEKFSIFRKKVDKALRF